MGGRLGRLEGVRCSGHLRVGTPTCFPRPLPYFACRLCSVHVQAMLERRLQVAAVFLGLLVLLHAQGAFDDAPLDKYGRPLYSTDQYLVKYKGEEWARVVHVSPGTNITDAVRAHHKAAGKQGSAHRE